MFNQDHPRVIEQPGRFSRKRLFGWVAAFAIVLGIIAAVPQTPAGAAEVVQASVQVGEVQAQAPEIAKSAMIVNDCLSGQFCVWVNAYYIDQPAYYWTISGGVGGYCVEFGGNLNDNVDSIVIKHGSQNPRSATLYEHAGCTGTPIFIVRPTIYGGPQAGSAHTNGADNWAPNASLPGKLPSSAWIIRG